MIKNIRKWYKIPNEQPAFGCQPAFGSHSQSLTNELFSSFFLMRLTWASCMCAWWKRYFFIIFQCLSLFLTMQTHAQACIRWSKYTTHFSSGPCCQFLYWHSIGVSIGSSSGGIVKASMPRKNYSLPVTSFLFGHCSHLQGSLTWHLKGLFNLLKLTFGSTCVYLFDMACW